jgi:hypothetical protein
VISIGQLGTPVERDRLGSSARIERQVRAADQDGKLGAWKYAPYPEGDLYILPKSKYKIIKITTEISA